MSARLAGTGATHCDEPLRLSSDFQYFLLKLRRDRSDPLRQQYLPTDQKVGGSNPFERAKVQVTGLQIGGRFGDRTANHIKPFRLALSSAVLDGDIALDLNDVNRQAVLAGRLV
jgi:hypothetical protein